MLGMHAYSYLSSLERKRHTVNELGANRPKIVSCVDINGGIQVVGYSFSLEIVTDNIGIFGFLNFLR